MYYLIWVHWLNYSKDHDIITRGIWVLRQFTEGFGESRGYSKDFVYECVSLIIISSK